MSGTVPQFKPGDTDSLGKKVLRVLAREEGKYIIYETTSREISIEGPEFEKCNTPGIFAAMNVIADLTIHYPALKEGYNGRLGYAYKMALDGDTASCEAALKTISEDMRSHLRRKCVGTYQRGALMAIFIPPILFLIAYSYFPLNEVGMRIFSASVFSALGGFLSVLIGSRKLDLDLKARASSTTWLGASRIAISVICGIVFLFLIRADLVLGPLNRADNFDGLVIACFVAGFSEMLVPNILKNLESATR
jgi:hypothetical protein